ncbi:Gfo/Idh/MocA family oxidoreductase (plasmid) [Phaeobacter sp. BS23]|uniref:Gfo/Idh/MocA family protein n=1 Tax=Phaeobacter sp. BS23 TaxID=2907239 RepID=UPI003703B192
MTEYMQKPRLKLALIGCGKAGAQHMAAVRLGTDFDIVCCFDTEVGNSLPDLIRADSIDQILGDFAPDAVALCVPPGAKAKLTRRCLEAELPLMLEKPPFMDMGELAEVEMQRAEAGIPIHVMLQHRFATPQSFCQPAETGGLGTLLVCRARGDSWFNQGWHANPSLAHGGILSHLAIHYLDMAIRVLGRPRAFALGLGSEVEGGIERQISGTLSFEGGGVLSLVVSGHALCRSEALVLSTPTSNIGFVDGVSLERADEESFVPAKDLRAIAYRQFANSIRRYRSHQQEQPAMLELSTFHDLQTALDLIRAELEQANSP